MQEGFCAVEAFFGAWSKEEELHGENSRSHVSVHVKVYVYHQSMCLLKPRGPIKCLYSMIFPLLCTMFLGPLQVWLLLGGDWREDGAAGAEHRVAWCEERVFKSMCLSQ